MKYIPIIELPILIIMVLIRALMLRQKGIKAILFGATDKTDFILIPIIFCFFYALCSVVFELPFPGIARRLFWDSNTLNWLAVIICSISLVWFGITLKIFGDSFRVGIDEKTTEKLITRGTFAVSRNPVYAAFIAFFLGIFLTYPTIVTSVFLMFLISMIHRQILREENFLKNRYGKEYEEYCGKVRRYI